MNRALPILPLALACFAGTVSAQTNPVFNIPRLDNIVIDGNGDDWGDRGFRVSAPVDIYGDVRPPANFDPSFRLGWDDRGLLVLVNVTDDVAVEYAQLDEIWREDNVHLSMANMKTPADIMDAVVAPGRTPKFPDMRYYLKDRRKNPELMKTELSVELRRTVTKTGYCIEARLPWTNLGLKPEIGLDLLFQFRACDSDDSTAVPFYAMWHQMDIASSSIYPHAEEMHRIRLAADAGPAYSVTARRMGKYRVGSYPTVRVAAPADFAGKTVEMRQGEKLVSSGQLQARDGRATLTLLTPPPAGDKSAAQDKPLESLTVLMPSTNLTLEPITVALDGAPVDAIEMKDVKLPPITITAQPLAGKAGRTRVRVGLAPQADVLPDIEASLTVFDTNEKQVAAIQCRLEKAVDLDLPVGLVRMQATAANFFGYKAKSEACYVTPEDPRTALDGVLRAARRQETDPALAAYAGWLNYLATKTTEALKSDDPRSDSVCNPAYQLALWSDRIARDPDTIHKIRGVQEWAYLCAADGTGQPFLMNIPNDYRPDQSYDLRLQLHALNMTHMPREWESWDPEPDCISLRPCARGRATGYVGLAGLDPIDATAYVQSHWNINPSRIFVVGGSMGGAGTFRTASQRPDLFAAMLVVSGSGMGFHLENLLHVPLYCVHGTDDQEVYPLTSRVSTEFVRRLGGIALQDEEKGVKHGIENQMPAMRRATPWLYSHTRPAVVSRVLYTATSERNRGAYWAEVAEWAEGRPATFDIRVDAGSYLHMTLDNVGVLKVDLVASPANRKADLHVYVGRRYLATLTAPLPEKIFIVREGDGWKVSAQEQPLPEERLHFPGGAMALFRGEPIMIVWGTHGSDDVNKRMAFVAELARHSVSPAWSATLPRHPGESVGGTFLYGIIPGKPDDEVTDADMQRCNLVLIGTAAQNSVVARIAQKLPARVKDGRIETSDGVSWGINGRAWGLLHCNPAAPKRLVYWVASERPEFYATNAPLMSGQTKEAPPDFVLMSATGSTLVAARRFDSRWKWEKGYTESPLVSERFCAGPGRLLLTAESFRREIGLDFVMADSLWNSTRPVFATGETRAMDVVADGDDVRIPIMELTGEEVMKYAKAFAEQETKAKHAPDFSMCRFIPDIVPGALTPSRTYRVAMPAGTIGRLESVITNPPEDLRLSDCSGELALRRQAAAIIAEASPRAK